jgi:hypothetical protein
MLIEVGPHVGLRPCEWLNATIVGHKLHVVNAKGGNGRAMGGVRSIGLGSLPVKIAALVTHLIGQVRLLFAEASRNWRKVLGRLGERLARVCARIGIRRWSLYTTRHAAIANWKRAGLSDAEISALAGHSSTRTARQHYAGGRHGWTADFACARPDPDFVAAIVAHNSAKLPASANSGILSVTAIRAAEPTDMTDALAVPAPILPRSIVVEIQPERVPTFPVIEDGVISTLSHVDTIWEADEAPAFGMG